MSPLTRHRRTLGLILPTLPQGSDPGWDIATVAAGGEAAGADALWACDHLAWHTPVLECFTALTLAAGATETCALGTCVLQLPLRPAPLVAKTASSLSLASRGRFILGVGVGLHQGEFDVIEAEFHARGKRTDTAIACLRDFWRDGVSLPEPGEVPAPSPRYRQLPAGGDIPIWIGGSGDVSLRRAARLGEGWMPLFVPSTEMSGRIDALRKETEAAGRPADAVTASLVVFVSVGRGDGDAAARSRGLSWMSSLYGIPAEKFDRHLVAGSPARCAEELDAFYRAGVEHLVVYVTDDRPVEPFAALSAELDRS